MTKRARQALSFLMLRPDKGWNPFELPLPAQARRRLYRLSPSRVSFPQAARGSEAVGLNRQQSLEDAGIL